MAGKRETSISRRFSKVFESASASAIVFLTLSTLASRILTCMVPQGHYPKKSIAEILERADVVVWGKNLRHFQHPDQKHVENSFFQVYCIYKDGGSAVSRNITIYNVSPVSSCKGESLNIDTEYLISLKRRAKDPGIYEIHHLESNPLQEVSVKNPTDQQLLNAANVRGLQHPCPPDTFKRIADIPAGSNLDVPVDHSEAGKCPRNSSKKYQCYTYKPDQLKGNGGNWISANADFFALLIVTMYISL